MILSDKKSISGQLQNFELFVLLTVNIFKNFIDRAYTQTVHK